jgi:transposase InsO family protein
MVTCLELAWLLGGTLLVAWALMWTWVHRRWRRQARTPVFRRRARQKSTLDAALVLPRSHRKPQWIRRIVISLAVHDLSCRQIANHFNRRFGYRITIGKSWVAEVLRAHALEIADQRRAMRRRAPRYFALNHTWALDLSFYTSAQGVLYTVLGIIDHGSRRLLLLKRLPRKCTFTLLGHLLLTMARFGVPTDIRTDNESMFHSALWTTVLKALHICHRRGAPYCPWHNARIERLFGTLKPLLKKIRPASAKSLRRSLKEFQWFYNHVRVHQNLKGLTPMEAWQNQTLAEVQQVQATQAGQWISALDGLMVGYYARC